MVLVVNGRHVKTRPTPHIAANLSERHNCKVSWHQGRSEGPRPSSCLSALGIKSHIGGTCRHGTQEY